MWLCCQSIWHIAILTSLRLQRARPSQSIATKKRFTPTSLLYPAIGGNRFAYASIKNCLKLLIHNVALCVRFAQPPYPHARILKLWLSHKNIMLSIQYHSHFQIKMEAVFSPTARHPFRHAPHRPFSLVQKKIKHY